MTIVAISIVTICLVIIFSLVYSMRKGDIGDRIIVAIVTVFFAGLAVAFSVGGAKYYYDGSPRGVRDYNLGEVVNIKKTLEHNGKTFAVVEDSEENLFLYVVESSPSEGRATFQSLRKKMNEDEYFLAPYAYDSVGNPVQTQE